MFYEFLVTAILSRYNLTCQPIDTSMDPLALRVWQNKLRNGFITKLKIFEIDGQCLLVLLLFENHRHD